MSSLEIIEINSNVLLILKCFFTYDKIIYMYRVIVLNGIIFKSSKMS